MRTLSVILLCLIASTAFAVDEYGWHPSSLDIGGQHILTFQTGVPGMSAAERRAIVEFRLTKALTYTQYYKSVNMSYQMVDGGIAIFANGILVVTATTADARVNSSTLEGLAGVWGANIKRIFEIVGPSRQLPHTAAQEPKAPISLQ